MMVGLMAPTGGDILIESQSIRTHRAAVLNRIGVCPQESIHWEKPTCLEQLEFVGVYAVVGRPFPSASLLASLSARRYPSFPVR